MTRPTRRAAVILPVIPFLSLPAAAQLELPTPPDHYETFDADAIGLGLFTTLSSQLDFGAQMMGQQFMSPREEGESPKVPRANVLAMLNSLELDAVYGDILELIIHQSSARRRSRECFTVDPGRSRFAPLLPRRPGSGPAVRADPELDLPAGRLGKRGSAAGVHRPNGKPPEGRTDPGPQPGSPCRPPAVVAEPGRRHGDFGS